MGTRNESYEWFRVQSASPQACRVKSETINFFDMAGVGSRSGARKSGGSSAANGPKARGTTPQQQQQQQAQQANGVPKQPASATTAAAAASAAAAAGQVGAPRVARQAGAPGASRPGSAAGVSKPLVKQASARIGNVHAGITHAEAVQAALAASSSQEQDVAALHVPPLRNGYLDLPRRRCGWARLVACLL